MEDIIFNTVEELHQRLMPALRSKSKILSKSGFSYINEDHVWEFMLKSKWKNEESLALCEMVNDILHTDNMEISDFFHAHHKKREEIIYDDFDLPKLKS